MRPTILVLATARLTTLVAQDEITEPLRQAVDNWASSKPDSVLRDKLAYLVSCSRCVSVWAAAGVLIAERTPLRPLVNVLAASQAALSVLAADEWIERH